MPTLWSQVSRCLNFNFWLSVQTRTPFLGGDVTIAPAYGGGGALIAKHLEKIVSPSN